MTVFEAAEKSGFAPYTIRAFIRRGELVATMPRGKRYGWELNETQFKLWMAERRRKHSNEAARRRFLGVEL